MSYTKYDKEFLSGYEAGYKQAIDDVRQKLVWRKNLLPLEVFEDLNRLAKEAK